MSPVFDNPYRIVEFALFSGEYGFLSDVVNFIIRFFSSFGWNIRLVILTSLFLQIFLIIFSPSRKRTNSFWLSSVWLAYLLADWAAGYCVGLISKSEAGKSTPTNHDYLMAFWCPFLLLHLGGPYTISAFALEDNELWLRHLLALVFQFGTAALVFRSVLHGNTLFLPTVLVFVAGTAKYLERIAALSTSSINKFRKSLVRKPDAGPNYAKLMEEHSSRKMAGLPVRIIRTREHPYRSNEAALPVNDRDERDEKHIKYLKQVQKAHFLFLKFRGLIVDMIYSFAERRESLDCFASSDDAEEAYRVIEIELDFMYEFFYTKASLVRHPYWPFCKYLCFILTVVALGLFTSANKDGIQVLDIVVTYALLYGALVLDILAFLMHIFTDHTATLSVNCKNGFFKLFNEQILAPYFLSWWIPRWLELEEGPYKGCQKLSTGFKFRRWSGSISGHNLLKYSLDHSVPGVYDHKDYGIFRCFMTGLSAVKASLYEVVERLGGGDLLDQLEQRKRKSNNPFLKELWEYIFERLKEKSDCVKNDDDAAAIRSICSARGEWILRKENLDSGTRECLKAFMEPEKVSFDESLLLWHIATNLCYHHMAAAKDNGDTNNELRDGAQDANNNKRRKREISKLISDYMLYLLVMQPNMMSAVAGVGQLRLKDTCEEAQRFFISKKNLLEQCKDRENMLAEACKLLSEVPTEVKPSEVRGDRSKSVLFDACRLAKVLNDKLEGNKKWEFISSVWVELLSYTAMHSRPTAHVQLLSRGGELVSFVWLLMVQLGLSPQFQIREGDVRVKLIVG